MKTFELIISFASAVLLLAACDGSGLRHSEPGKTGATLSIGTARIVAPTDVLVKSQAGESIPVPVYEDPESGTFLSVTTTVTPMATDEPATRVTEVTTDNLKEFKIDGYLGDEILTCKGASQDDKDNRHFINGTTVEKDTDGYWYFQGDAPQWRSCVDHHFWAYKGSPTGLAITGTKFDKASFSYTNTGEEDLVIGYQHQMWVDEVDGKVGSYDAYPLKGLKLKHALAEVVIDCSQIQMKMLNVNGGTYIDIPNSSTFPADEMPEGWEDDQERYNPRLRIKEVLLLTPSEATCDVTVGAGGVEFDWNCPLIVNGNTEGYTTCKCDGTAPSSVFVIPQNQNGNVLVLKVYDSWRDSTTPIYIEIPAMSGGAEWRPGYRYYYQISGTLVAPYYKPIGELDPNFHGKNFQKFAVVKNLMAKYVKTIKVTWTGLAVCQSQDTPMSLVYTQGSQEPQNTDSSKPDTYFPMASIDQAETWKDKVNVGFIANTNGGTVQQAIKGSITNFNSVIQNKNSNPGFYKQFECEATFEIPDTFTPPITFWLLYDGDNNGNANWLLYGMKIEVTEFKYPIQIDDE